MNDFLSTAPMFKSTFESDPSWNLSLSNVFFPLVPDAPGVDRVTYENSKMLHALVTCMEQKTCHQNQTKGASSSTYLHFYFISFKIVVILSSPNFRDYLTGSRSGENIWYEFLLLFLPYTAISFFLWQGTFYSKI